MSTPATTTSTKTATSTAIKPALPVVCPSATPGQCPTHFVIHSTGGEMSAETIKKQYVGKRSKAHIYLMTDGTVIENWPMADRNVWATKIEKKNKEAMGSMIHVELNYKGTPTDQQYSALADQYVAATKEFGALVIVPHLEVDRGLEDGHSDPENFDFDKLYKLIKEKGFNLDRVEKIDQTRYERPNQADQECTWPPVLTGKPKRKPTPKPTATSTKAGARR